MKKWESHEDIYVFHGPKTKMKLILRILLAQGVAT